MANRRSGTTTESIVSVKDIEAVAQKNTAERARLQAARIAAEALQPRTLVDIVMPVYNEGENIAAVLTSLEQHVSTDYRLLICYDSESDTTLPVAKKFVDRMNIEFVKNKGKGVLGAVMSGFDYSDAQALLIYCGDDITNAPLVDVMYKKLSEGHDMVIGSRFMNGGCMEGCPLLKSILVRTAAYTLRTLARLPVNDPTNGIRIYTNRMIKEIPIESTEGWSFNLELLVKGARAGYSIAEVPYRHFERAQGQSRFQLMKWLPAYLRWYFYAFATAWKF